MSPETAFALLLDTAEQTTADRLVGLRSLRAAFGALADSLPAFQSSGAPQHARVEVLVGQRRIAESLDAMAATARREILALRPNDLAAPERWGEAARRSGQVLARGCRCAPSICTRRPRTRPAMRICAGCGARGPGCGSR